MALMCGGGIIYPLGYFVLPNGNEVHFADPQFQGIANAYFNNPDGPIDMVWMLY